MEVRWATSRPGLLNPPRYHPCSVFFHFHLLAEWTGHQEHQEPKRGLTQREGGRPTGYLHWIVTETRNKFSLYQATDTCGSVYSRWPILMSTMSFSIFLLMSAGWVKHQIGSQESWSWSGLYPSLPDGPKWSQRSESLRRSTSASSVMMTRLPLCLCRDLAGKAAVLGRRCQLPFLSFSCSLSHVRLCSAAPHTAKIIWCIHLNYFNGFGQAP